MSGTGADMALWAENLTVGYGPRIVLREVAYEAQAGEFAIIVGPNGSGKTTLMRALTGDLPYRGSARLNGRPIGDYRAWQLAAIRAVLPQDTQLAFPFTVGEVVRIGLTAGQGRGSPARIEADSVLEALDRVDLAGFGGRFYQELSGGERQRVQLARVLCQIGEPVGEDGPRWLFLDEPVSSLDISHQLIIMELARDFARAGGGVVAVMHDLNLTAMFADRVTVIGEGAVAATGAPEAVFRDEILSAVFGCRLRVGAVPDSHTFVLPQSASIGRSGTAAAV